MYHLALPSLVLPLQEGTEAAETGSKNATPESEVEIEAVEEIVETPKERAKRVKRETKEKAAKAKEESRKQRAIEKVRRLGPVEALLSGRGGYALFACLNRLTIYHAFLF